MKLDKEMRVKKPQSAKGVLLECDEDDDECVLTNAPPRPSPPGILVNYSKFVT